MCIYLNVLLVYLKVNQLLCSCFNFTLSMQSPSILLELSSRYSAAFKHKATGLNRLIAVM